ncbi:hypothetical protein SAMN06265337_2238 [Hymenobacter gelipurpurascens]|uniref:Uncharacterized protein n=1 Tax=Hymenobacter gelipurpurascens TaxID=89968 RepID=A0A212TQH0_9BACT|nr:hypothetical protein [Hymenobacter gelipurpurascens]SNC68278.1 hypothetical protein SAMN06265337_2238 [Hymenobacter gelipurpurascens]
MANQSNSADAKQLTETLQALQGGLTSIPISTASTTIDQWQEVLQQSGIPALQDIDRELGNLQSLLTVGASGLDGQAIGRSLSMLGSQTSQVAATAAPELRASLTPLADFLLKAGGKLEDQK